MASRQGSRRRTAGPRSGSAGRPNGDVFVNCPFDDDYLPCFEALLFAIAVCGYRVRCALEEDDGGDIRFEKLVRLIADSDHTIHDLSRTEAGAHGLPRFNMPFELGLAMGARRFGRGRQREKRACIMVAKAYVLPRYLSDLAGNDPAAHGGNPHAVIRVVRDHLHRSPEGRGLPGALHMIELFERFRADLPFLARQAQLSVEEAHARLGYRNYLDLLAAFCATMAEVAGRYGQRAPLTSSSR